MTPRIVSLALISLVGVATQGCAAAGLALFGVGAGVSSGTAVSYSLDSVAYKTFTASERDLRTATLQSLKRMAMDVKENKPTDEGTQIIAEAGDRTVDIEIDRITPMTSRMRVNVKKGWFLRDRATATEIIVQTEHALEQKSELARRAR